jgi:hypothetical protein
VLLVTVNIKSRKEESQPLLAKGKIDKVLSSTNQELYAPLLRSDEEQEREATDHSSITAAINAAASLAMDTSVRESNNTDNTPMSPSSASHRWVNRCLNISTAADALPFLLKIIMTNGKMTIFAFLGVYLAIVVLWLPFWLTAKLVTEIGVYAFMVVSIFFLGRCIIRYVCQNGHIIPFCSSSQSHHRVL